MYIMFIYSFVWWSESDVVLIYILFWFVGFILGVKPRPMEAKIETLSFTLENQPEFQRVITFLLNEHVHL